MKKFLFSFIVAFSMMISSNVTAQFVYTDATLGYTITIPGGWTHEAFESGELLLRASHPDGTAAYDINMRKLEEGQTSYDYLLFLEGYMADAGYSENYVEADKRSFSGADAAYCKADDLACGVYTKEKNGVIMIQSIILYKSGQYVFMTIATYPADDAEKHAEAMAVFNSTFSFTE